MTIAVLGTSKGKYQVPNKRFFFAFFAGLFCDSYFLKCQALGPNSPAFTTDDWIMMDGSSKSPGNLTFNSSGN